MESLELCYRTEWEGIVAVFFWMFCLLLPVWTAVLDLAKDASLVSCQQNLFADLSHFIPGSSSTRRTRLWVNLR